MAMMSYYNAPNHQLALNMDQENMYLNHNQPQPKQQIPIDVVSDLKFKETQQVVIDIFYPGFIANKIIEIELRGFHQFVKSS